MIRRTHWSDLTASEQQILYALADGDSRREIAAERGVAIETVKSQTKTLFAKLGARNAAHAVAIAYHRGLFLPMREAAA